MKDVVIEGPEDLTTNDKSVFLFVTPIVKNNKFMGEVVAALDADYVIKQLGLNYFEKGNYDYELWRVNELGEYKTIIATSNKKVDFSQALKLDFSLPASWNISIQPKVGWLSTEEKIAIGITCIGGVLLILFALGITYTIDSEGNDTELFKEKATSFLEENEHIVYLTYFAPPSKKSE